jgi:hypothetical protein
MKTKEKVIEPKPGNVFRFPLGDGRFGACRVIREMNKKEVKEFGGECLLVAACSWIGSENDELCEGNSRPVLHLSHHSWNDKIEVVWIPRDNRIPKSFIRGFELKPDNDDLHMKSNSFGSWESFPLQVLLQWRWDNDRSALEAEERKQKTELEDSQRKSNIEREKYLNTVTLEELLPKKRFKKWKGFVSTKLISSCNDIFKETISNLIVASDSTKQERLDILKMCIEKFNEIDEKSHFIETEEREDICSEFEEVTYAAGFKNIENLADEWRGW